jgi:GNAT superfamily N-acetyltransferase
MDREALLALYDVAQRINIDYPDTRKERRPHVIRFVSERGAPHFILFSQLEGADVEAVIAEEQAYFRALGKVEWKVYEHDRPPDLRRRLAAQGFEVDDPEAVMILDLHSSPEWQARLQDDTWQPAAEAGHRLDEVSLRRLERPEQLKDVQRIEETVWGEPFDWLVDNLSSDMAVPGYLSAYVAYVDRQPACAGWINFHANGQFADLWGGSTLEEHRGRGLYTAVLAARLKEAADRGYRFVTVDASPMSQPILARQGFQQLTRAWACKWPPG